MTWFRFKKCLKCRGDLVLDDGDWLCLQCGTYYYTGLYQVDPPADQITRETLDTVEEKMARAGHYPSQSLDLGHSDSSTPLIGIDSSRFSEPVRAATASMPTSPVGA